MRIISLIFLMALSRQAKAEESVHSLPPFTHPPQEQDQSLKVSIAQDAKMIEDTKKDLQLIRASQQTRLEEIKQTRRISQLIEELERSKLEKESLLEKLNKGSAP